MLFIIDNIPSARLVYFVHFLYIYIFTVYLIYDASGRAFESLHGRGRSAVSFVFIVMFLFTSLFKMHCTRRRHTDGWVLLYYSHNKIIPVLCCFESKQWNWRSLNSFSRNCVRFIIYWSRDWFIVLLDERWHGDSYRIHDNPQHFITYPEWISPARHKRSHVATKVMSIANVVLRVVGYCTNVG